MSGTSTGSAVRAALFEAIRSGDVAAYTGLDTATWASTTTPHVFDDKTAPFGARNRGRLPFVDFYIESQPFTPEGDQIGVVESRVTITVNIGGTNRSDSQEQAEGIMAAIFAAVRADTPYFAIGNSAIQSFDTTPCWHKLTGSLTVQHTYDTTTFEASP